MDLEVRNPQGQVLELAKQNPEVLVTIIQRLKETLIRIEAWIAELEWQLTMNSQNSSHPPYTDGFKLPKSK